MFSLSLLVILDNGLSIFFIFQKSQLCVSLILCIVFFFILYGFWPTIWLFLGNYSSRMSLLLCVLELSNSLLVLECDYSPVLSRGYLVLWIFFLVVLPKCPHKFWNAVSSFSFSSRMFVISFFISVLTQKWCSRA